MRLDFSNRQVLAVALIVVVNLVVAFLIPIFTAFPANVNVGPEFVAMGCLFGQSFLVGIWLGLGTGPLFSRLLLFTLLPLASGYVVALSVYLSSQPYSGGSRLSIFFAFCTVIVLLLQIPLWPLRWIYGWHISPDGSSRLPRRDVPWRFSLLQLIAWSFIWISPLAFGRMMFAGTDFGDATYSTAIIFLFVALAMSCSLWATLLEESLVVRLVLLLPLIGLLSVVEAAITAWTNGQSLSWYKMYMLEALLFNLGIVPIAIANLLALRVIGFRLIRSQLLEASDLEELNPTDKAR